MLQYLKLFFISLVSGIFVALPASSSAHFAYLNNVLRFTENDDEAVFYLSVVTLVFSVISFFFVKKLVAKGFKVLSKSSKASSAERTPYINMFVCLGISMFSALIMLIPYSKGKLLSDIFTKHLVSKDMLVMAVSSVAVGFIGFCSVWYSRQRNRRVHKFSTKSDIIRMTVYSFISNFFPGFSRFSISSGSLIVSGVNDKVVVRDVLLYMSPSLFIMSLIRIIRCLIAGVSVDVLMLAVCVAASVLGSVIVLNLIKKINIKHILLYFSVYSVLLGILAVITAFYLI